MRDLKKMENLSPTWKIWNQEELQINTWTNFETSFKFDLNLIQDNKLNNES